MEEATRKAREEARALAERERSEARESRARKRKERSKRWDLRTDALTLKLRAPERAARRRASAAARQQERAESGRPALSARAFGVVRRVLAPLGRVLMPLGRAGAAGLSKIAPLVSRILMLFVRVPAALIAIGLDLVTEVVGWLRVKIGPLCAGLLEFAMRTTTPARTLAFVCAGAAVALAASQFADYRGVAVGAPGYEGEIQSVAPAPFTDLKPAGSAHAYALIPLAAIAIVLAVMTARGRWRLGRAVGLIGLAGIVVGLAIDMPQGLDAGDSGVTYLGTDARLIEGFWAQMAASATLLFAGPLLGLYAKRAAPHDSRSERRAARDRKRKRTPSSSRRRSAPRRPSGASA